MAETFAVHVTLRKSAETFLDGFATIFDNEADARVYFRKLAAIDMPPQLLWRSQADGVFETNPEPDGSNPVQAFAKEKIE